MRNIYPQYRSRALMLVVILVAVIMLMALLKECSHSPSPFTSKTSPSGGDTLDIGIEMNPGVYSVRGDSISGRDYEILQRISEQCGVPMKFHPFIPLDYAVDRLSDGTYDVLVASIPLTSHNKEQFLMTDPVYVDREVLVQLPDSAHHITSQIDLAGDTVWVPSGARYAHRLANLSAEIGDTIYVMSSEQYSSELLFILTATGRIRYAVINEDVAQSLQPSYPEVDISLPISFNQFQSWALRKDNTELCDSLNAWIARVKQ